MTSAIALFARTLHRPQTPRPHGSKAPIAAQASPLGARPSTTTGALARTRAGGQFSPALRGQFSTGLDRRSSAADPGTAKIRPRPAMASRVRLRAPVRLILLRPTPTRANEVSWVNRAGAHVRPLPPWRLVPVARDTRRRITRARRWRARQRAFAPRPRCGKPLCPTRTFTSCWPGSEADAALTLVESPRNQSNRSGRTK